ncbi:hypothetical protein Taro_007370 [Colocasia esculenta]|uniref:Uncharacterized protein n=1 Tax=Colocasia esculenta TaxID=4460 RepID=A0A843U081_COLES|nr:hypothetical protein [Colocasia esculenta]
MQILACILPVVTFLCQPVLDAVQTCVGNLAQRFLDSLKNWADGLFGDRVGAAVEVPEPASEVVGAEEKLTEIRNHLEDDSVGIIGIHGMGGIGKTTILQMIINEFFERGRQCPFDLVVWVTVSQTVSIPDIQKQIADRLSLPLSDSSTDSEKKNARVLSEALSHKRFLMLLDDIWEAIDLQTQTKIGIPGPRTRRGSKSKIAFTTRLSQVCDHMGADKIVQVKSLDEAASWKLFCSKLRTKELVCTNPIIGQLAQQVVDKCGGLPLALITVGRAMANREDIQDWEYAVKALDHFPERLEGVDDHVLRCLKFSYDYLRNDNIRSALLFCAMYPEDAEINRKELIEHWIGEGLVDDENDAGEGSIDDARGAGQTLINKLRDACLLEPGTESSTVRMHDAVRDMALWLNRHPGHDKVDGFLVKDIFTTTNVVTVREHIKRIWVRSGDLEEEMFNPDESSNNRTLLLNNVIGLWPSILRTIASSMKGTLRVLNLSGSNLKVLPSEVGLMTELHYLNLSSTGIRLLPEKLGELIKLRQLLLNDMYYLQEIPRQAIAGLWSLQVLTMWGTVYDWEDDPRGHGCRQLEVGDLEAYLPRLEELHIQLGTPRALERFLTSHKLCRCTRGLCLAKLKRQGDRSQSEEPLYGEGGSLLRVFSAMGSSLKRLDLQGDDAHPWDGGLRISLDQLPLLEDLCLSSFKSEKMPEVVLVGSNINPGSSNVRLSTFTMRRCDGQKVLKLVGAFPCLQVFILRDCSTMEELVMDDDAVAADIGEGGTPDDTGLLDRHFPMLREIHLLSLPALKSMGGNRPLRLPASVSFKEIGCPELTRLPVDAAGVPKLKIVRGERKWGGRRGL